jgi:hypothetical protein
VGVKVGVSETVGVLVGTFVCVAVGVNDTVGVSVGVGEIEGVIVAVPVSSAVGVIVSVTVGVGVGGRLRWICTAAKPMQ